MEGIYILKCHLYDNKLWIHSRMHLLYKMFIQYVNRKSFICISSKQKCWFLSLLFSLKITVFFLLHRNQSKEIWNLDKSCKKIRLYLKIKKMFQNFKFVVSYFIVCIQFQYIFCLKKVDVFILCPNVTIKWNFFKNK